MIYISLDEIFLKIKDLNKNINADINFKYLANELNLSERKLKRQIKYGKITAIDLYEISELLHCPIEHFIKKYNKETKTERFTLPEINKND